ncbi:MAG: mechanosensitive ion channel family protein [Pseudonocardia sp.]
MTPVVLTTHLAVPASAPTSAAQAPNPTPSPSDPGVMVEDGAKVAAEAGNAFWDWFISWPLHILIILAVGGVVLVLLRRVIGHVTERIATGAGTRTTDVPKDSSAPTGTLRSYLRRTPVLVEDALALANPLAGAQASQRRAQRARTVGSVLRSSANVVVGTIMGLMILQEFDVNVAPLVASAGVVGVALGFGAQSLVKDFISGILLLVEDQFGVGDTVDLGSGAVGTVEEVQLRVTQVRAFDGTLWYVRNGEILRVGNMSQGYAVAVVDLPLGHTADIPTVTGLVERAANERVAAADLAEVVLEPPQMLGVERVGPEGVTMRLTVKVKPGEQFGVQRALNAAITDAFEDAGVPRPTIFPGVPATA